MLHSTDTERLSIKERLRADARISLGRGNRTGFMSGMGAGGVGNRMDRVGGREEEILG